MRVVIILVSNEHSEAILPVPYGERVAIKGVPYGGRDGIKGPLVMDMKCV